MQTNLVRNLYRWLVANPWHESLTIKYDLNSYGNCGESHRSPLYIGEKKRGEGREVQVSQPDIVALREDTQTVDLIVEVEALPKKPKDFYGLLASAIFADNHTPSYEYGSNSRYTYRETLIVLVTLRSGEDAERVAETMRRKVPLAALGIRGVCVCGGEEAEARFQELIRSQFSYGTG